MKRKGEILTDEKPQTYRKRTANVPSSVCKVRLGKVNKKNIQKKVGVSDFEKALDDFVKYRKAMRKPLTERGAELIVKKLATLFGDDDVGKIASINQSIERGWQGVFPLQEQAVGKSNKGGKDMWF